MPEIKISAVSGGELDIDSTFRCLLVWMRMVEKASWKASVQVTVAVGGAAWLIFSLWLKVPFPMGLFELFLADCESNGKNAKRKQ